MLVQNETLLAVITDAGEFLSQAMPYENTADLRAHLVGLEAVGLRLAKARVEALKTLHDGENKMLYPKDKELTELDRRVKLQAAVSELKRDAEYLIALEELVARRLELGTILLTA
jgi:hypothetical protein